MLLRGFTSTVHRMLPVALPWQPWDLRLANGAVCIHKLCYNGLELSVIEEFGSLKNMPYLTKYLFMIFILSEIFGKLHYKHMQIVVFA